MQEEIYNQKSSIDLIEYRLDKFESNLSSNFDKLSDKLDNLITKLNENEIKQENLKTRVQKLEEDISNIKKNQDTVNVEITNMKVTIAEKLTWSAGGGLIATVLMKITEGMIK